MKVKALRSFSGAITMRKNEVRDIAAEVILNDLLQAGYVVSVEEPEEEKPKTKAKTKKKAVTPDEDE